MSGEETARSELLALATAFAYAKRVSFAKIGRGALNDNSFFLRVASGSNFTLRTYDRVMTWFSANWPDDTTWPAEIARPNVPASHEAAE